MRVEPSFRVVTNATNWARPFVARLLEPGLVSYEDQGCGKSLVTKETIDRWIQTFVGRPVVLKLDAKGARVHPANKNSVTPQNMKEQGCGYITEVFYNSSDGWWYGRGVVDTDEAVAALQDPTGCSVGYHVNRSVPSTQSSSPGGRWHDIPFHDEIQEFEGLHLAIVDSPRYEAATIRLNAKQPKDNMSMFKWFKKAAPGATVSADDAAQAAAAKLAADNDATKAAADKLNATAAPDQISGESEFEIATADGKTEKVTLAKLIEAHNGKGSGEMDGETEIVHNGKTYKLNALVQAFDIWEKEKQNAADEAKTKAEKETKEKEEADKKTKENATAKPDFFRVVLNAAANAAQAPESAPQFDTLSERLARGQEQFGTPAKK